MLVTSKFCRLFCGYEFFLRVTEHRVEGIKDIADEYIILEIISFGEGARIFRGKSSQKYVGIKDDGTLATFDTITEDCVFLEKEKTQDGKRINQENKFPCYSVFQSRSYPAWYLGITADRSAVSNTHSTETKESTTYAEDDLSVDYYALLGCLENLSFEVKNAAYTGSNKGNHWVRR